MSRLRLPSLRPLAFAEPLPLRPVRVVATLLGRRQFLRALGAATVLAALPVTWVERGWARRRGRFFTRAERRALKALADSILPPDADPGAVALGAVDYIEGFLTALDSRVPRIYAGGPFSGRQPYVDYDTGVPGRRPRNSFKRFVPPTRLQSLHWRWQLLGSDGLSAGDRALIAPLDAQLGGPLPGLRGIYRDGLASLDALSRTLCLDRLRTIGLGVQTRLVEQRGRGRGAHPRRAVAAVLFPDPRHRRCLRARTGGGRMARAFGGRHQAGPPRPPHRGAHPAQHPKRC